MFVAQKSKQMSKSYTTSLKEQLRKIKIEEQIKKKNQKLIDSNTKAINLIVKDANSTNLNDIVNYLQEMKEYENKSSHAQSIKAYAKFHQGRLSGLQIAIDLLNSIKNNKIKIKKDVK